MEKKVSFLKYLIMSYRKRIFIILHLCFVFTYLFYLFSEPFLKEILAKKTEIHLYERIVEEPQFFKLPLAEQQDLQVGLERAHARYLPPFFSTLSSQILVHAPPFLLAWALFSLASCLLLLFRIEGAQLSFCLLPLLLACHFCFTSPKLQTSSLFPTEEYVLATYVPQSTGKFRHKRTELLEGWKRFLLAEWGETHEEALFAFNKERVAQAKQHPELLLSGFAASPATARLLALFFWNLFLAYYVQRKEHRHARAA